MQVKVLPLLYVFPLSAAWLWLRRWRFSYWQWLFGAWLLASGGLAVAEAAPGKPHRQAAVQQRIPGTHRVLDSLQALVQAHPQPDTVRLVLLTELGDETEFYDVRAAGSVRRQALRLARRLGYRDFLAETLLGMADYHIGLAQYDSAVYCLRQSRPEFARLHDLGGQMRCLGRRARIAEQQGRYAQAVEYASQAMAMSSTGDQRRFHTSLVIQVAGIYSRVGEYQLARNYLNQAMEVACYWEYPDRVNLILAEYGELNRRQRQWAEARRFYGQSRTLSLELGNQPNVLLMDLNLAEMSEQLGNFAAARRASHGILRRAEAANQVLLQPRVQALLARVHLHFGRPDSAVWYGLRSLRISQQNRSQEGIRAASAVLAPAYAQRRDFARAYQAQQQLAAYADSLGGAELARRAGALQLSSERRQQRVRLQLLHQQQELERLRQQQRQGVLAGLLLLLALGGGGFLWTYRQRQQRRETALRNSLAADLHDDVGSLLSQISLQSGLLQEGLSDGAGQQRQLGQISDASRSAVRQLNDVVWSLDAHNDHLPDLLDRMRDYGSDVLGAAGLEATFTFPAALPAQRMPLLLRRNLYLIYKEALHNAVKHATGATTVVITMRLVPGTPAQLVMEISDNGVGTCASPNGHVRRSGHGLRNIHARAQALGGAATSGGGAEGFRVCVAVPLPSGWKSFGTGSTSD